MGIAISVSVAIPLLPLLIVSGAAVELVLLSVGLLVSMGLLEEAEILIDDIQENQKIKNRNKRQIEEDEISYEISSDEIPECSKTVYVKLEKQNNYLPFCDTSY